MKELTPEQFLKQIRNLGVKFDIELLQARRDIGQHSVDHFKSSFDKAGFAGGRGEKWPERLREYKWPIMHKTGRLKDSIKFRAFSTSNTIVVETAVPYAKYHNDPSSVGWKRNQFTNKPITRRQFMGNSQDLERWIQRRFKRALINTFTS